MVSLPLTLSLTYAAGRAGLPEVSVLHLDAGDPALPLQLVARVAGEGHRVAGLAALPVAAAIHGHAWVSAGRGQGTCRGGGG